MPPRRLATVSARWRAFCRIRQVGVSAIFVTGRDDPKIAILVERCVDVLVRALRRLLTGDVTRSGNRP